jgi:hypothetical protein
MRLGGDVGALAEVTVLYDPFQHIHGVQAAVAVYLNLSPKPDRKPDRYKHPRSQSNTTATDGDTAP